MTDLKCTCCEKPLSGGIDTFGDIGQEMCWTCYSECSGMGEPVEQSWYGLAPHHHDLSITGGIIGSTVLEPLSQYKLVNGEYEIEPNLHFMPDYEEGINGAMGTWTRRLV